MSGYALANAADAAADRFGILQACYDPVSRAGIVRTGVAQGKHCLEVGAGGGSMAAWLAGLVGPTGRVVATDLDMRRIDPGLSGLANVRTIEHDIVRDPLPGNGFDLIHARLVLLHLPERREVLARLADALAPGGRLVIEDFDCGWTPVLAERRPGQAALFTEVHRAFLALLAGAGADVAWGRRLYQAVLELGLEDVTGTVAAHAWRGSGTGIGLHRANTTQLSEELIASGLTRRQMEEFWELLEDPGFAVQSYPLVTVSGRRGGGIRKAPSC
jgi:SAM-dependent methyltransferase